SGATVAAPGSSCESCHAEIVAEWRASFHRAAFTDSVFQASFELERPEDRPFCVGCHAPLLARGWAGGATEGVTCSSCHEAVHERLEQGAPARARRDAADGTRVCAGCHEFTFGDGRDELVQKTV